MFILLLFLGAAEAFAQQYKPVAPANAASPSVYALEKDGIKFSVKSAKRLNDAQRACILAQTDVLNATLRDNPESRALLRDFMKIKRLKVALTRNASLFGPNAKKRGELVLEIALNSKGECLFTSREKLQAELTKWLALYEPARPTVESARAVLGQLAAEPSTEKVEAETRAAGDAGSDVPTHMEELREVGTVRGIVRAR